MSISRAILQKASLWSDGCLSCCFHIAATVDIVETHDVVFAQVSAALHFDQFHRDASGIGQSVFTSQWDVRALILSYQLGLTIAFHHGCATDHDPVFGTVVMHL